MTKEETIALLKGLGFPSAHIKTIEDNWDKKDFVVDPSTMIPDFQTAQKELYEDDPDIVQAIDAKAKGRERDIMERAVKKAFGLSAEETKDKDFNAIIDIAKKKVTGSSDKTTQELQEKLLAAEIENKRLLEEEIPTIKTQVDKDRKAVKVEVMFEKVANELAAELIAKNPKAMRMPFATALKTAKVLLNESMDFDIDDKDENILVVKDKKGLKIKASSGTAFLTPKDAVLNVWKENQFLAESNADPKLGPDGKPIPIQNNNNNNNNNNGGDDQDELDRKFPHLAKARKHAEDLKSVPKT